MTELTAKQLQSFRQSLEQIRDELNSLLDISSDSDAVVTLDQSAVGRLSRMDAIQQQQMASANREAYRKRLMRVNRAIKLVADGSYGYCQNCGDEINQQRLKVRPECSFCIDCQTACEE